MLKVKYTTVYILVMYCIFFLNLGFLNIKVDYAGGIAKFSGVIAIMLFILYLFQPKKSKVSSWTLIYVLLFCIEIIFQILRGGIIDMWMNTYARAYFSILYFFPLNEIINSDKKISFFKGTVFLGVIAEIYRIAVWYLYNFFHINLAPGLFRLGFDWIRDGHVRMQATFLDSFIFFILVYMCIEAYKCKKMDRLLLYFVLCTIYLYYAYFVYAARTVFLAYVIGAILIIVLRRSENLPKIMLATILLTIVFLLLYNTNFVQQMLFSMLNDGGTTIRTNGIALYGNLYKNTSILNGLGLGSDSINFGIVMNGIHLTTYSLSDLRIIGDLYRFGLIGFTICILIYLQILLKILESLKKNQINAVILALLVFFIAGSSLYERIYIMQLPVLVALVENYSTCFIYKNSRNIFNRRKVK